MGRTTKTSLWLGAVILISALSISSVCPHLGSRTEVVIFGSEKIVSHFSPSLNTNPISNKAPIVELTWRTLSDVEFKDVYIEELDAYYWKPTFGEAITELEGREVFITGYIIPVDYDSDFYVLSRYPFANCYFCGGAGPESVIDLKFKSKHHSYKTDERLTFKGTLKLNSDDVYQMNYILEEAVAYN